MRTVGLQKVSKGIKSDALIMALYHNKILAKDSNCNKQHVRCEIRDPETWGIISSSLNGLDNDLKCKHEPDEKDCKCAERKAIDRAIENKVSLEGMIALINLSPCKECVDAIIENKFAAVIFTDIFKENEDLHRLIKNDIHVLHFVEKEERLKKYTLSKNGDLR